MVARLLAILTSRRCAFRKILDFSPNNDRPSATFLIRGRHHEAFLIRSEVRRLRDVPRKPFPGRFGLPSAPTKWGCLQWLDVGAAKAAKAAK